MDTMQIMPWKRFLSLTLLLGLFCLQTNPSEAQGAAGTISGVVSDDSGGRLPGATVTITNVSTGQSQSLVTNEEGRYRAVALQPTSYTILAELSGFASSKREVVLTVGANLTVDLQLSVAGVEETVTVTGETPLVDVTSNQLVSVVESDQVDSLPNLGRNFLDLAQLLPGSGPDNSRVQYFNPTKFGGAADQRNGFTTMIDGGAVDDAIWGSTTMNISQESVQEFNVLRNQFDAEYGAALNSVVTVVTKSGTNQFRGSGFYYGRDKALNSKDFFANEKAPFAQKRFGGSIGGPIVRDKTHFFAAYEYSNVDTAKIIALPDVNPFANQENGIFPSGSKNHMLSAKLNHRFGENHSLAVRYAFDDQKYIRTRDTTSDSNQIDEFSRTNSIVAEDTFIIDQNRVNTLRMHYLDQNVGNEPHSFDLQINRPSVNTGQSGISPQYFPRTRLTLYDTFYLNTTNHDIKIGGEFSYADSNFEAHFNEHGAFSFTTDAPFDSANPNTLPFSFVIQKPGFYNYKSSQIALFFQDDWRLGDRLRVNLGLRYDYDTNLRNNDFYASLLDDPSFAGIDNFISKDRGNDLNNLQPRVGFTYDLHGTGNLVLRGGYGLYVTRNRPWFQLTSMDRSQGGAVRIEDPTALANFPDINAVLGGRDLDEFLASGGARSLFLISDDYTLPYSHNFTLGMGWQLDPATGLDVDFVNDLGRRALGGTDRNLPATGRVSADNPRPVSNFSQVNVMENYTTSLYTALEVQLRRRLGGRDNMRLSYTLSRSYRDGVYFYSTFRGTQRTPQEQGYNDTDQRHTLTLAAAKVLPLDIELSGIVKLVSGSPMRVQAGYDVDGDLSTTGDRPVGLPTTVGRADVEDSLSLINDIRSDRGLPLVDRDILNLDPYVTIDMRVTKGFTLPGGQRLDLLLEGFNLTNHVNYQPFTLNANIISQDFLIRNSARPMRQFQWGVHFRF
jgi:outer membrane receptor protein involved in Fe transport